MLFRHYEVLIVVHGDVVAGGTNASLAVHGGKESITEVGVAGAPSPSLFAPPRPIGSASGVGSATTLTITVTQAVAAGETVFVRVSQAYTSGGPTMTDSRGNPYSRDRTAPHTNSTGTNILRNSTFRSFVTHALQAGDTITVAYSQSVANRLAAAEAVAGLVNAVDGGNDYTASGAGMTGLGTVSGTLFAATTAPATFLYGAVYVIGVGLDHELVPSFAELSEVADATLETVWGGWSTIYAAGTYSFQLKLPSGTRFQLHLLSYALNATPSEASGWSDMLSTRMPPRVLFRNDEASGSIIDAKGNAPSGVIHGTVARRQNGAPVADIPSGAVKFNGSSGNYIEVADDDDFSVTTTGELTVAAWVRPDSINPTGAVDGQDPPSGEGLYLHWMGKGDNDVVNRYEWMSRFYAHDKALNPTNGANDRPNRFSGYYFNPPGGLGSGSFFQEAVTPGEWIFYVVEFDLTGPRIFKNGLLKDADFFSDYTIAPERTTAPLRLGTAELASWFDGAIGPVAFWDRRLTTEEVYRLWLASPNVTGAQPNMAVAIHTGIEVVQSPAAISETNTTQALVVHGGVEAIVDRGENDATATSPVTGVLTDVGENDATAYHFRTGPVGNLEAIRDGVANVAVASQTGDDAPADATVAGALAIIFGLDFATQVSTVVATAVHSYAAAAVDAGTNVALVITSPPDPDNVGERIADRGTSTATALQGGTEALADRGTLFAVAVIVVESIDDSGASVAAVVPGASLEAVADQGVGVATVDNASVGGPRDAGTCLARVDFFILMPQAVADVGTNVVLGISYPGDVQNQTGTGLGVAAHSAFQEAVVDAGVCVASADQSGVGIMSIDQVVSALAIHTGVSEKFDSGVNDSGVVVGVGDGLRTVEAIAEYLLVHSERAVFSSADGRSDQGTCVATAVVTGIITGYGNACDALAVHTGAEAISDLTTETDALAVHAAVEAVADGGMSVAHAAHSGAEALADGDVVVALATQWSTFPWSDSGTCVAKAIHTGSGVVSTSVTDAGTCLVKAVLTGSQAIADRGTTVAVALIDGVGLVPELEGAGTCVAVAIHAGKEAVADGGACVAAVAVFGSVIDRGACIAVASFSGATAVADEGTCVAIVLPGALFYEDRGTCVATATFAGFAFPHSTDYDGRVIHQADEEAGWLVGSAVQSTATAVSSTSDAVSISWTE